jgi:hypothetical protein
MVVDKEDRHWAVRESLHDRIALATEIRYPRAMKQSAWWQMSVAIATVTLADRSRRRRFISGFLVFILVYFSFGNWVIDDWLMKGIWRMLLYWGFLGAMCLFLVLMAVFDALAAIGEERVKVGLSKRPPEKESSPE